MSWAILNASRDNPSRNSPAMASRGAKPIECTKPSNFGQPAPSSANSRSMAASSATSQSNTRLEPNSAANSVMRSLKRSPT